MFSVEFKKLSCHPFCHKKLIILLFMIFNQLLMPHLNRYLPYLKFKELPVKHKRVTEEIATMNCRDNRIKRALLSTQ